MGKRERGTWGEGQRERKRGARRKSERGRKEGGEKGGWGKWRGVGGGEMERKGRRRTRRMTNARMRCGGGKEIKEGGGG